jgi:hypothetical protein
MLLLQINERNGGPKSPYALCSCPLAAVPSPVVPQSPSVGFPTLQLDEEAATGPGLRNEAEILMYGSKVRVSGHWPSTLVKKVVATRLACLHSVFPTRGQCNTYRLFLLTADLSAGLLGALYSGLRIGRYC